jgi:putative oxidoreductase
LLAGTAEFFLLFLLVPGPGKSVAAPGLLVMTAVIRFLVLPSGWPTHILWFAIPLYLLKHGGGRLALDNMPGLKYRT